MFHRSLLIVAIYLLSSLISDHAIALTTVSKKTLNYGAVTFEATVLSTENTQITLVPELGGRIFSIIYKNEEFLFRDEEAIKSRYKKPIADVYTGNQATSNFFPIWGGSKVWLAPQGGWNDMEDPGNWGRPPLASDLGQYSLTVQKNPQNGTPYVVMESPVDPLTNHSIRREIRLYEDTVVLIDSLTKLSSRTEKHLWSPWEVSQVLKDTIPMVKVIFEDNKGILRKYWDFSVSPSLITQKHTELEGNIAAIDLKQNPYTEFKYGGMAKAVIVEKPVKSTGQILAWKRSFKAHKDKPYAHYVEEKTATGNTKYYSNFETYNHPKLPYFELEAHTYQRELENGESSVLEQTWEFTSWPMKVAEIVK
jgi:hypothetical protein